MSDQVVKQKLPLSEFSPQKIKRQMLFAFFSDLVYYTNDKFRALNQNIDEKKFVIYISNRL